MSASMTDLPQELIDQIASYIPRYPDQSGIPWAGRVPEVSNLPPYATISKQWQYAIERLTFPVVHIKSTELSDFASIFVGHRREVLAYIGYAVVLPTYSDIKCAQFEKQDEKQRNNEAFTEAIVDLLQLLNSWEQDSESSNLGRATISTELELDEIYSPMDGRHRGGPKFSHDQELCELGKRNDLWEHRYEHSFLRLLDSRRLPPISRISKFTINYTDYRRMEPRSAILIAQTFKNLDSFDWTLYGNEKKYIELQRDMYRDFAELLPTISTSKLKSFALSFCHLSPRNHAFTPQPTLHASSPLSSSPSLALHALSQTPTLQRYRLDGPIAISSDLFWPSNLTTKPHWPNLTMVSCEFSRVTPLGEWYFIADPKSPYTVPDVADLEPEWESDSESSSSDSSLDSGDSTSRAYPDRYRDGREKHRIGDFPSFEYRTVPNPTTMTPLLVSMARAVGQMPKLREFHLVADLQSRGSQFDVKYLAPGEKDRNAPKKLEVDEGMERLHWQVGRWRPEKEVKDAWRESKGKDLRWKFIGSFTRSAWHPV